MDYDHEEYSGYNCAIERRFRWLAEELSLGNPNNAEHMAREIYSLTRMLLDYQLSTLGKGMNTGVTGFAL